MRFCSDPESESRQRAVGLFKYRSVCGATRVRSDNPLTLINNIPLPLKLLQQIPLSHRSRTSLSLTASSSSTTASYVLQNRNITKSNGCRSRPARLEDFYPEKYFPAAPVSLFVCLFRNFISGGRWKTKCLKNLSERVKELAG